MSPVIDRLALIGVGLIGGSIARAAREYGVVRSIVATARSEATRKRVVELGIADQVVASNAEADALLTSRGIVMRAVRAYGLPNALRMTIGTEEANRLTVATLAELMEKKG